MPIANTVFNVLAKFKFEIGAAVASSATMGKQLDGLSQKVEGINNQFKILAINMGTSLTGGQAGMIGVLRQSVIEAEKLNESVRKTATLLTRSPKSFKEGPLNMVQSQAVMRRIFKEMAQEADKFGLNAEAYRYKFENFALPLFHKGLTGKNFSNVRRLAKGAMLAEEIIPGLDRVDVGVSATNLVEGGAFNQGRLFRKLTEDTQAMKRFSRKASAFNRLSPQKRVETLLKAFEELTGNSDALAARMNTISVAFTQLENKFRGIGSVLIPLGEALRQPIIDNLRGITEWIEKHLRGIIKRLSETMSSFIQGKSVNQLYTELNLIASIGQTMRKSHTFSVLYFIMREVGKFFLSIGIFRKIIAKTLRGIGLGAFVTLKGFIRTWPLIGRVFKLIATGLIYYSKVYTAMLFLGRIFKKAREFAKESDRSALVNNTANIEKVLTSLAKTLSVIVAPFKVLTDLIARLLSIVFKGEVRIMLLAKVLSGFLVPINSLTHATEIVEEKLKKLREGFLVFSAALTLAFNKLMPFIAAIGGAIGGGALGSALGPIGTLAGGALGGVGAFEGWKKMMESGRQKTIFGVPETDQQFMNRLIDTFRGASLDRKKDKDEVAKNININNIAKLEIRNQFPENLEPDRVAVAIKNVFEKAATNPVGTGLRNSALIPGLYGS